eukprot:2126786-Rhodomonas_salina.1
MAVQIGLLHLQRGLERSRRVPVSLRWEARAPKVTEIKYKKASQSTENEEFVLQMWFLAFYFRRCTRCSVHSVPGLTVYFCRTAVHFCIALHVLLPTECVLIYQNSQLRGGKRAEAAGVLLHYTICLRARYAMPGTDIVYRSCGSIRAPVYSTLSSRCKPHGRLRN